MSDPYDLYLAPRVEPDPAPGRVEVRRGPAFGRWTEHLRVRDVHEAERLLSAWRRRYPHCAAAIFVGGRPFEDQARRDRRLLLERVAREISYLVRFAAEAENEGQPEDASQYRRCAEQLRETLTRMRAQAVR